MWSRRGRMLNYCSNGSPQTQDARSFLYVSRDSESNSHRHHCSPSASCVSSGIPWGRWLAGLFLVALGRKENANGHLYCHCSLWLVTLFYSLVYTVFTKNHVTVDYWPTTPGIHYTIHLTTAGWTHVSQCLSPSSLEVNPCNLSRWGHGSWDLPLHTGLKFNDRGEPIVSTDEPVEFEK